jgi:PHD/YefM family antitoxin component YafN of YafNO toxin-antitoxin module
MARWHDLCDARIVSKFSEKGGNLAVLLGYEQFLIMQRQLQKLLDTLEVLASPEERSQLDAGIEDLKAGRTKSVSEIKLSLKKKR